MWFRWSTVHPPWVLELEAEIRGTEFMKPDSTPFLRPTFGDRLINRLFGLFVGLGLGLRHNYLLQVTGRRTGRLYSTPVNILDFDGRHFLVAPRGETQWVRNARASGQLWLKRGRTRRAYRVRELSDSDKPILLKTYLDRFSTTVQRYFPVRAGSSPDAFLNLTPRYPVFELLPQ
jgi:deazaflavin-dependent oxidoreductase (nitroreductase family)